MSKVVSFRIAIIISAFQTHIKGLTVVFLTAGSFLYTSLVCHFFKPFLRLKMFACMSVQNKAAILFSLLDDQLYIFFCSGLVYYNLHNSPFLISLNYV